MATRKSIFPGDTFPVAYECRKPDPDDPIGQDRGLPITPDLAYARLKNQDDEWVELGGPGITTAAATIIPQTGETKFDTGAIVKYTVPDTFTQEEGNYSLFITAEFAGNIILTEDKKYRVLEFR